MDITNYIPNVFGTATPSTYEGLLGMGLITPEQMAQTQKTANIQGLLGAGLALAQGMSKIGPRRSAAENVLGALAGGFGAAGGAYQQGLQNIVQQQQLAQAQIAQQDANIKRQQLAAQQQAIEQLIKSPDIANDPLKIAFIRANPNEALKMYTELLPFQQAIQQQGAPQGQGVPVAGADQPTTPVSPLEQKMAEKKKIETYISSLSSNPMIARTEGGARALKTYGDQLTAITNEIKQLQLSGISKLTGKETPEELRALALQADSLGNKSLADSLNLMADQKQIELTSAVAPGITIQEQTSQPVTQETQVTGEKTLPPVEVTEKPSRIAGLIIKAENIRKEMDRLSDPRLATNKSAKDAYERNSKQLEEVRKQISEAAVAETNLKQFRENAPEQFRQQIDNLEQLATTGQLTPDQLSQRMGDISRQINEYKQKELDFQRAQTNYQNEAYRVAQDIAPGVDPSKYTPQQIAEIQRRLVKQEKELRIAGRTLVTQTMYGDKEFLRRRIEGAVNAEDQAINALNVANDVRGIVDVLKPFKGGKIDEFKASIGSYLPDTSMAQIATANDLAVAIRARIAPTLRVPGSGATSDFETKQFLAAIPSLLQYANGRELMAVYAERLANRAVAAADLRSKMVEDGTYSVKNFQKSMKDQGLDRVFTDAELATLRSGKTTSVPASTLPEDVKKKYGLEK